MKTSKEQEAVEQEFKDAVFKAFSKERPEVTVDENGFIVVPRIRRAKSDDAKIKDQNN